MSDIRPTPETDAMTGRILHRELCDADFARKLERERDEAREQLEAMREKLDWQNMPNRREPTRGGYEFYINEEWTCIRDAALDGDVGFQASLMKTRFDPDDERVRIRRVLDDDAILEDAKAMREAIKNANHFASIILAEAGKQWQATEPLPDIASIEAIAQQITDELQPLIKP